jgi:hypothetical protein
MIVIPSQVQPGSLFSVILTVTNVGTSIAYTAYATPIAKDLPLRITGSRSAYIGNIETNLPTTTTISLQMGNTTESRVTLPIIVSYLDNLRSLHNITINVPIPIIPATSSSPTNPGTRPILSFISVPLLVVAIVVIGGVVFVLLRRRRR